MSTALFGSNARSASKNLVEFKAGKMELKGKVVHPDKRKGLVYLYQSDDDGVMHFCWKDRTTGSVEEDLMIFPDDCEYRRVKACTTGRAYVLKFRSSSRRLFFWMQESRTDKDDEHCRKINELLNNPPSPGSHSTPSRSAGGGVGSGSGGGSGVLSSELGNLRESDLHNIIGNISQQQLMQILGSGVPNLSSLLGPNSGTSSRSSSSSSSSSISSSSTTASSATTTTATTTTSAATPPTASTPTTVSTPTLSTTTTSSTAAPAVTAMETSASGGSESSAESPAKEGPIQLADLQSILSGMMAHDDGASGAGTGVDLSPALTAEALQPILSNPSFVDKLRPYLPPTSDPLPPAEQLRGTVTSPQFKQAVSLFSHALQSGQLGPLIKQFGLGDEAVLAAVAADMEAFVKALGKSSGGDAAAEGDKDDDDDNMAVD